MQFRQAEAPAFSRCRRARVASLVVALVLLARPALCEAESGDAPPLAGRIEKLIRQLGSPQFAARERAESELSGLGLAALDALNQAQFDDDVEIAVRAHRLIRTIQVRWSSDDDPKEVRKLLRDYGRLGAAARRGVIGRLGAIPSGEGMPAIARIARYEPSVRTAKHAALAFLTSPPPPVASRPSIRKRIAQALGKSQRDSVKWTRTAITLWDHPDEAPEKWAAIVSSEELSYSIHPAQSGRGLVRAMLLHYVDVLLAANRPEDAQQAAARVLPLVADDRTQLLETSDWILQHRWWSLMDRLHERFHDSFHQNTMLLFRLAEARRRAGDEPGAAAVAKTALDTVARTGSKAVWLLGMSLQNDGFFHWAEYAYRRLVDAEEKKWSDVASVHVSLAEMLHDLKRDREAAEVLQLLVDAGADPRKRQAIERECRQPLDTLAARAAFFKAKHFASKGDSAAQKQALAAALAKSPRDSDVLIALYRLGQSNPQEMPAAKKHIDEAVQHYRSSIEQAKKKVAEARTRAERNQMELSLAQDCNQVAWLIANTEGDTDWALECSLLSLEIYPDSAGFRDTLARCYFAKGDVDRAIDEQRRALSQDPFSPPLKAQLKQFEEAKRRKDHS